MWLCAGQTSCSARRLEPLRAVATGNGTSLQSIAQIKAIRAARQGTRHAQPAEPSTNVLLEERRASGSAASAASNGSATTATAVLLAPPPPPAEAPAAAAADSGAGGAAAAIAAPSGSAAAGITPEEMRWLRTALESAVAAGGDDADDDGISSSSSKTKHTDQEISSADQQQQPKQQQRRRRSSKQLGQQQQQQKPAAASSLPSLPLPPSAAAAGGSANATPFAAWSAYCQLHACSASPAGWAAAARGAGPLAASVRGSQQAQQAWELMAQLAARPLPPAAARLLGHSVVSLVSRTLARGDYSLLRELLASRAPLPLGRRAAAALLRAACAADVDPADLQALLRRLPEGALSARAFFVLLKSFEARGLVAEATHCAARMAALGLKPTPAMEAALRALRDGRAAAARGALAQR